MAIGIKTTTLVSITGATASITADVSDPANFHCHRFFFDIGTAASIELHGSHDGTTFYDVTTAAITTDGEIREVDRPWSHLRVSVTGNNGTTKVIMQQFYSNTSGAV